MNTAVKAALNIPLNAVQSSQIAAIGHDPDTNTLAIRFTAKEGVGSLYHYENVDAEKFAALRDAKSIGSHFYAHIKPRADLYPYTKITAAMLEEAPVAAPDVQVTETTGANNEEF